MNIEVNPSASEADLVGYFIELWEDRVQMWQGYLDGTLPPKIQNSAHLSRQGRRVDPAESARECLRVATEYRDAWKLRFVK